jgi:hypothetical protein
VSSPFDIIWDLLNELEEFLWENIIASVIYIFNLAPYLDLISFLY